MAKTRSQEDDPVPQWLLRYEEATTFADWLCRSRKKENPEDQICNDEELTEIEAETKSSGIEDRAMENEANSDVISASVKKEQIPQIQVPISKLERGLQFHNVSPTVCEDSQYVVGCDELFGHQEAMLQASHVKERNELLTKSTNVTSNQAAHYLFDKMSLRVQSKRRHLKCHKSWMFKFKQRKQHRGKPRTAHKLMNRENVMEDYHVYQEGLPLWLLVRFKFWKFKFINRKLQKMMRENQAWVGNAWFKIQLQDTTVSNWAPDCVKQLQQSGNPIFQKVHETLWLTLPLPPTNQMKNVYTQIHMVQWVWHCVKHDTQQTDFHVWHRWKNKAEKLKVSLVCSGKRWSFVVYAFYDHTVVLRKEPILSPKIKRGFKNKIIVGMSKGQSVKQHHGRDSENAQLYNNNIKRHYTGLVGIGFADLIVSSLQNLEVKVSSREGDLLQENGSWAGSRPIFSSLLTAHEVS